MKSNDATGVFAALSHASRLAVFRLLVEAGREGVAASLIARKLKIQPATLSFHLKELSAANLIRARQEGRYIYYAANYATMDRVMAFLTENCCGGDDCEAAPVRHKPGALK